MGSRHFFSTKSPLRSQIDRQSQARRGIERHSTRFVAFAGANDHPPAAFLDDFFWRSFPYTQVEATPVLRTRGESSPLSPRDRSCVCSTSTGFIRRVPDPRRV